ncbi:cytochrome c [Polluticoccus soli]|uniref:cytochrome c n=1 Tax=Polluticoccus soli TaxID=3034150 RepID=UPI0023E1BC00|nr:cbb3-type cytochrome c oxidase subunit II [Flavipsychrobacter sp. JY13-12]
MSIFHDHRKLFALAGSLFLFLTYFVAIRPALVNQKNNSPLPGTEPLHGDVLAGKKIYIAEGCVACHTQQVRNVDMDKAFGSRPGIPADYAHIRRTSLWANTATLTGTERTGPDLTDVGNRQPSKDWNLMHLFNPRSVVAESIMPSYEWLFEIKKNPGKNDVIVNVPAQFLSGRKGKVIATKKALQLVAYLQSLKQAALPGDIKPQLFLYKRPEKKTTGAKGATAAEGKTLYEANCQSCHQPTGEGLAGAFPPLKGSPIVTGDNLELYVDIIMNGYDARPEFGVMAAVGTNMSFTENDVAAIINYERTSWGNNGKTVTPEEIKKLMDFVKIKAAAK